MSKSYLTIDEYKRAPTSINVNKLDNTNINIQNAQDAELSNVIRRASAWIDNYCQMPSGLSATINTETKPTHITRDGFLRVQPYNAPIIQVSNVQWRLYPSASWTIIDISNIQVYERHFEAMIWFQYLGNSMLTLGNNFAYPVNSYYSTYISPSMGSNIENTQITVQYTYVNGYANTTLQNNASMGNSSIVVNDTTGIMNGTLLTLYDGANTEDITVLSLTGNTLQLSNPLLFNHNAKIAVSAIPADIKQACILVVNYFLKERGSNAIAMANVEAPTKQKSNDEKDLELAKQLLRRYRKVV
ncbi:hypothetical protein O9H85_08165 [Paenibacillus filicis]|uniref:Uncharacterized protein n=1 Tax=Paenibacillus gyeongsangnamensis TaxID=3388067 RepID=A0ABT4Q6K0_9BACL|nr:hypothetical protein [Paenibacillus filicis]MCZ8512407.1 hypothetical protein [Paenibacillus filicis]